MGPKAGIGSELSRIWGKENNGRKKKEKKIQQGKVRECRKRGKNSKAEFEH